MASAVFSAEWASKHNRTPFADGLADGRRRRVVTRPLPGFDHTGLEYV